MPPFQRLLLYFTLFALLALLHFTSFTLLFFTLLYIIYLCLGVCEMPPPQDHACMAAFDLLFFTLLHLPYSSLLYSIRCMRNAAPGPRLHGSAT